jgi:predicted SAM-dependent methyltransferase
MKQIKSNKVCIICRKKIDSFLPKGFNVSVLKEKKVVGAGLRNAKCPNCKSSDRDRLIYLFIKNKTNLLKSLEKINLLHVAPEVGLQKIIKSNKNINYVSMDKSSHLAEHHMDIENIEFEDNYFEVVIANHVFEHVSNDKKAMKEIYRVMKPEGWAILQVPISMKLKNTYEDSSITNPEERIKAFGQNDHIRIYGKDYKNKLSDVGFEVKVSYFGRDEITKEDCERYGINDAEAVYFCVKKL